MSKRKQSREPNQDGNTQCCNQINSRQRCNANPIRCHATPPLAKRNEKLVKLLNGVADMNLGDVKDHDIDAFEDAYEYLMTMYASNAGKSGGEFFTPADVSELLTTGHRGQDRGQQGV